MDGKAYCNTVVINERRSFGCDLADDRHAIVIAKCIKSECEHGPTKDVMRILAIPALQYMLKNKVLDL